MKRPCDGFTLLEVLVAFVILALGLSVILRIFSGGLANAASADEYTHALLLAQSRLSELSAQPSEGETVGEQANRYRWHGSVRPWVDAGGAANSKAPVRLLAIEVSVDWGEAQEHSRRIVLSTLRLVPRVAP